MINRVRANPGLVLTLLCLVLFVVAWVQAWSFPDRARLFPLYMIGAGIVVVLLQLVVSLWRPPAEGASRASGADLVVTDDYALGAAIRRAALEFGWIGGLLGAIYLIGAIIPLALYPAVYSRWRGKLGWKAAGLISLGFTIIMIGVFEHLLHLSWPRGVVAGPQREVLEFLRGLGI